MDVNNILEAIYEKNVMNAELIHPPLILNEATFKYILSNIKFNTLLILFTISCFTSFFYCYKRPISKKNYVIIPSYDIECTDTETQTDPDAETQIYVNKI